MSDWPKVIAQYLPQYHAIPENDLWWGKGYTDWEAVKQAESLYSGHRQPRVPLYGYYSLDEVEPIKWQAKLAREYGVDGFGIYHYWFSGKQNLLTKPAEIILENKDIDIGFMFFWDNCSWIRTWSAVEGNDWAPSYDEEGAVSQAHNGILAELSYGREADWKAHFDYLLPFFQDERYLRKNGKPLFGLMKGRNNPEVLKAMAAYWDVLAKENGFDGMEVMSCDSLGCRVGGATFDTMFRFSPFVSQTWSSLIKNKVKNAIANKRSTLRMYDYDDQWQEILEDAKRAKPNTYLSGFVSFDDTPRRGTKARIIKGESPEKFEMYFSELYKLAKSRHQEYIFISAWNEWGEGTYLEPDEDNAYAYLEALARAISDAKGEEQAHGKIPASSKNTP